MHTTFMQFWERNQHLRYGDAKAAFRQYGELNRMGRALALYCDQCELLMINGVACHETGCPNSGARWDKDGRRWARQRVCFECGCTVDADAPCCSSARTEQE